MTVEQQKIINSLRAELNARRLGVEVAKAYKCTAGYVSNVLNGRAAYNPKLIEVATTILEKDKQNYNKHLKDTATKLGLR